MLPITQNKRRIKVQHIIGKGTTQVNVTRNVTLPSVVRKIVDVHAEIVDLDYEIIPDKVIIKGTLHKQIYYVEEGDYVVKEYTIMREEFTDFLHVPGATPQMDAILDANILFVDTNPVNGCFPTDSLFQIAVVAVDVTVVDILTLDVVTDVCGEGITATKELFSVESLIGMTEKQVNYSVEHVLDMNAKKVYDIDCVCKNLDYEILPDKVLVRGTLHKQVYYVDYDDESVQEQTFENEFTVVVDVPGARPNMEVYPKCHIEFCEAKLTCDAPTTQIRVNCVLQVIVKVTEYCQLYIVTDVQGAMACRCRIRVEDIIGRNCHQEAINQSIDVNTPEDVCGLKVKKAKNTTACLRNVTYEKIPNKVIVKGIAHVQVYYVACGGEQELRETSADIPFTTFVHFDGLTPDTSVKVRHRVEYTDAKIDGVSCETSTVRAIAIIEACVRAYQVRDFIVVTDITREAMVEEPPYEEEVPPVEEPNNPPTEEVCPAEGYPYTVVAGDSLSKIAALYQAKVPGITWQDIAKFNNLTAPYTLNIGQDLRIPCVVGKG